MRRRLHIDRPIVEHRCRVLAGYFQGRTACANAIGISPAGIRSAYAIVAPRAAPAAERDEPASSQRPEVMPPWRVPIVVRALLIRDSDACVRLPLTSSLDPLSIADSNRQDQASMPMKPGADFDYTLWVQDSEPMDRSHFISLGCG